MDGDTLSDVGKPGQQATWTEAQRKARLSKLVERNRANHHGEFLYEDAGWLRNAYTVRGLTLRQMAAEASCGLRTIARWMAIHGVPTDRSRMGGHLRGEDHPRWRGGVAPCPDCGGPRSRGHRGCVSCYDKSGPKNPKWRGDQITNTSAHARIVVARGKASGYACTHCLNPAAHWAYDHTDPNELRNPGLGKDWGPFSLDPAHYIPLCAACHKRFDMAWRRRSA